MTSRPEKLKRNGSCLDGTSMLVRTTHGRTEEKSQGTYAIDEEFEVLDAEYALLIHKIGLHKKQQTYYGL